MPNSQKKRQRSHQKSLTHYLLRSQEKSIAKNGTGSLPNSSATHPPAKDLQQMDTVSSKSSEYIPLSKSDLDNSLEALYIKLLTKFQTEIQKSTYPKKLQQKELILTY